VTQRPVARRAIGILPASRDVSGDGVGFEAAQPSARMVSMRPCSDQLVHHVVSDAESLGGFIDGEPHAL
jgi:hypothetical protein